VSAKDLGTGRSQHVTITGGTALDKSDIDRMIQDAEAYAAEDTSRKEAAEARNSADHAAHTVGKQLAEFGDQLEEGDKAPIQENLDALKKLLSSDASSPEDLKAATSKLLESSYKIGEIISANAQAEAASESGEEASSNDEVVEAEVVEDEEA
jgi:molecular chaperone DnaK